MGVMFCSLLRLLSSQWSGACARSGLTRSSDRACYTSRCLMCRLSRSGDLHLQSAKPLGSMQNSGEFCRSNSRNGNVLFSALMILIVLNVLVAAIMESAGREQQVVQRASSGNVTFHASESCVRESMGWLGAFTRPSESLPHTITYGDVSHWVEDGVEDAAAITRSMRDVSYGCMIEELMAKSLPSLSGGVGDSIGSSDGYGSAGDLSPAYFYRVTSDADGARNAHRRIEALVSVRY